MSVLNGRIDTLQSRVNDLSISLPHQMQRVMDEIISKPLSMEKLGVMLALVNELERTSRDMTMLADMKRADDPQPLRKGQS